MPAVAPRRLILIRHIHKLKNDVASALASYCKEATQYCDVILETSMELKGELKDLVSFAKVSNFGFKGELNIFDMTKLMSLKKTTESLKMLYEFYNQGMYPLQMMGALVWYWGKEGRVCGKERFEKGLKALQEADLNIKRSRLNPQYAVEKLVVELGLLRQR